MLCQGRTLRSSFNYLHILFPNTFQILRIRVRRIYTLMCFVYQNSPKSTDIHIHIHIRKHTNNKILSRSTTFCFAMAACRREEIRKEYVFNWTGGGSF